MLIPLNTPENWESFNSFLRNHLNLSSLQSVRASSHPMQALFEVTFGLSQTFLHKKSVAFLKGESPYLEPIISFFTKSGYQVQSSEQRDNLDGAGYVGNLKKDTLFVVACQDHAITSETHQLQELEKVLNEQKIFLILVRHSFVSKVYSQHLPYTGVIQVCHPQLAFGILGERFKFQSMISPFAAWTKSLQTQTEDFFKQSLKMAVEERKKLILQFESISFKGFQTWGVVLHRQWDRVLLYSPAINAEVWVHFLRQRFIDFASLSPGGDMSSLFGDSYNKKLDLSFVENFFRERVATTSFCDLHVYRGMDWWKSLPQFNLLSGLMVIDVRLLKWKFLAEWVQLAHDEVVKWQEGSL